MPYIVDISSIVLLDGVLSRSRFTIFAALSIGALLNGLDLLDQVLVLVEELVGVDAGYDVDWDVGGLVLEASMHVDIGVN